MPVITIALMGFFALTGGSAAPVEAAPTVSAESAEIIALKEETAFASAQGDEVYTVKLTSYNAVPEQTDANPHETASGAYTNPEVVAARSIDLAEALPWGTVIAIERASEDTSNCGYGKAEHLIGYRVVADSMHTRKRAQIDVLLNPADTVAVRGKEMNPSLALGICDGVTIRVMGKLDIKEIPETQEELRKIVEGDKMALGKK